MPVPSPMDPDTKAWALGVLDRMAERERRDWLRRQFPSRYHYGPVPSGPPKGPAEYRPPPTIPKQRAYYAAAVYGVLHDLAMRAAKADA